MIIRIYHECEGGIEKSVPRITVGWHHEACLPVFPVDGIFHPIPKQIMASLSYNIKFHIFIWKKFLNILRCDISVTFLSIPWLYYLISHMY